MKNKTIDFSITITDVPKQMIDNVYEQYKKILREDDGAEVDMTNKISLSFAQAILFSGPIALFEFIATAMTYQSQKTERSIN